MNDAIIKYPEEYENKHEHCWHPFTGMIHMVIPPGKTLQECCGCGKTRLVSIYKGCHKRNWNQEFEKWFNTPKKLKVWCS